jgi:hypothetical protein
MMKIVRCWIGRFRLVKILRYELRRPQSELNEEFGFRSSVNTSDFVKAFDQTVTNTGAAAGCDDWRIG